MTADTTIGRKEEGERLKRGIVVGMVGPVGSGKTTLAGELGKRWGIEPVQEKFGENPFLAKFYDNPGEYSFKCQMWFLTEKMKQLSGLDTSNANIIDPSIEMDYLYAQTHRRLGWMPENEWGMYKMAFASLLKINNVILPDISIVVNAKEDDLLKRIRERGRPYELIMLEHHPEYFLELRQTVLDWTLKNYPPKVLFDASHYNFLPGGKDLEEVLGRIEGNVAIYLATGRKHSTKDLIPPAFKPGSQSRDRAILL